jgi:hypothetical protein
MGNTHYYLTLNRCIGKSLVYLINMVNTTVRTLILKKGKVKYPGQVKVGWSFAVHLIGDCFVFGFENILTPSTV